MRYVHALGAALLALSPAFGQDRTPETEGVKKDIAGQRTMTNAHENAAKCLEAGKPEKECHE